MRHPKAFTLLSSVLCLSVVLSACSNADTKSTENSGSGRGSAQSSAPTNPTGKYDPPIEITAARPVDSSIKYANGESLANNIWTKTYESELGIKINYAWTVDTGQYDQKLNVTIASGDLPDVFPVNATQLKQLVDAGQVEDLTQIYDKYAAPFTKQVVTQTGEQPVKAATFNGKLYGIPNTQSPYDGAPLLWVRTDWLKKLNLPEPKTIADIVKISDSFTNGDPDGNGKKDTYGLAINKNLMSTGFADLEGLFNGYHAYPKIWEKDASGKLVYGSVLPEVKQALAQLQQMYKGGQIDKEFGVKDGGKVGESMNKIGMYFGQQWTPIWPVQAVKEKNPDMDWKAYPLVSVDDKPALSQVKFPVTQFFVVRKGAKHPEAAVKLVNLFLEKNWGKTNDYSKWGTTPEGTEVFKYAFVQAWPAKKNQDAQIHIADALQSKDTTKLNAEEKGYYDSIVKFRAGDIKNWSWEKVHGPAGSQSILNQYISNKQLLADQFYGAATPTMADKKSSLDKMELETFTKIIMGDSPVDEFDKFVENWKKLGGDAITQEVNTWFASQK